MRGFHKGSLSASNSLPQISPANHYSSLRSQCKCHSETSHIGLVSLIYTLISFYTHGSCVIYNCHSIWDYLFHASLPHQVICFKTAEAMSFLFTALASFLRKEPGKKYSILFWEKEKIEREEKGRKKERKSYRYKCYSKSKISRGPRIDH